jgi:hypothetical protein
MKTTDVGTWLSIIRSARSENWTPLAPITLIHPIKDEPPQGSDRPSVQVVAGFVRHVR